MARTGRSALPFEPDTLKALVFDVDGTLYRQSSVRLAMARRLLWACLARPREGASTLRALRAYRRAQELLRNSNNGSADDLAHRQVALAADIAREDPGFVAACVARWMEQRPLDLLARARRPGLLEFLEAAKRRRLRLAVFSDYPARAKLEALGIDRLFDVVVSAQDPDVQEFKPSPRGLHLTLARLGVSHRETIYVGDRADVDVRAASRAGMACVIIGGRGRGGPSAGWVALHGYDELGRLLGCGTEVARGPGGSRLDGARAHHGIQRGRV